MFHPLKALLVGIPLTALSIGAAVLFCYLLFSTSYGPTLILGILSLLAFLAFAYLIGQAALKHFQTTDSLAIFDGKGIPLG